MNFLIIADNPADYKLIECHLRALGLNAVCRRVGHSDGLRPLLDEGDWDLVLADCSLPLQGFQESLRLIRQRRPELPLIVISGNIGEEQVAELLKRGAWDFVLKENLNRLLPSIKRALEEAGERQARLAAEAGLQDSESRFRTIFDNSPIAINIGDIQSGQLIEVNNAWLRLCGYEREDVVGRTTAELGLYVNSEEREAIVDAIRKQGRIVSQSVQLRHKSREIMDVLYSADIVKLDAKPYLQEMMLDVSERKRTFVTIRESEKQYRALFDNMLEGFASCRLIYDEQARPVDFVYLNVNKSFVALTGLRDVIGKRVSEVIPGIGESNPDLLETYGRVATSGRPEHFETFVPPLGIWFSISVYSIEIGCFIAVFDNITAHKNVEAAQKTTIELLRICNEADNLKDLMQLVTLYLQDFTGCEAVGVRLREGGDFPYYESRGFADDFLLAENSLCAFDQSGVLLCDQGGEPVFECMCGNILCGRFNPAMPFFSERGSFWSNCTTELLASTTAADRQAKTRNRCNGEGYESVALVPLRSRGRTFGLFQFNDRRKGRFSPEKIALLEDLVAYVAIALAKLKADEELQLTSKRLQLATAAGDLGIWDWDITNDILVWDERMCELYGVSRQPLTKCYEVWETSLHPDDRAMALAMTEAARNGDQKYDFEFRIIQPGGTIKHIKTNAIVIRGADGTALRMIGMNQDVTERKHLEEQLLQSQKMEAVGQLAGGVAHDFNNILSVIMGYGGMLKMATNLDAAQQEKIDQIIAASDKAAQLTGGLLAFSRKQMLTPRIVNLNDIVQHLQKFLVRVIGEDVHLKSVVHAVELPVSVDSGQIEQALINLATNARDAMPQGGELTIETGLQEVEAAFSHAHGYGRPGRYAVISVADTGSGMDEAIRKKIFEPFFTTKESGKGTGLGMAIVYGIVKQHNGFINLYSEPGRGTTFRIYLPLVKEDVVTPPEPELPVPPSGGGETILVAEDDAAVRLLVESILTEYGYQVLMAEDGREAVDQFAANRDRVQLTLLDMIMPQQNGKAAAEAIRTMQPEAKILFSSGYTADFIRNRGVDEEEIELIMKPFQPSELLRRVRELLDR